MTGVLPAAGATAASRSLFEPLGLRPGTGKNDSANESHAARGHSDSARAELVGLCETRMTDGRQTVHFVASPCAPANLPRFAASTLLTGNDAAANPLPFIRSKR
jgi:hypothetical protein